VTRTARISLSKNPECNTILLTIVLMFYTVSLEYPAYLGSGIPKENLITLLAGIRDHKQNINRNNSNKVCRIKKFSSKIYIQI
jgi:hypothetical protein